MDPLLKSFISEHTAEYVLVPDLVRRLAPDFLEVIPIFFWATREGNSTAAMTMFETSVRILSAFARRPKIWGEDRIMMKINPELVQYSRVSADAGIPVLAGVPLVSALSQLRLFSKCSWFELSAWHGTSVEPYVEVMLDGKGVSEQCAGNQLPTPLCDKRIREIAGRSRVISWAIAVATIREIRRQQSEYTHYPFFGGYKPFHLVLPVA